MKQTSKFRAIYKLLKTNSNPGGVLVSKIIDVAIKKKVKPLDVNYLALRLELEYDDENEGITECSIETAIQRFMEILRGNKEVVDMFNNCNKLTAKKLIINILSLYYNEKAAGIIKRK